MTTPQHPHETAQAAPHGPHSPSSNPKDAEARDRAARARTEVRVFRLLRDRDPTGISGTGTVADGVQWPDGTVTIRWRGDRPSTVNWQSLDDAMAIHGHGGATRTVWATLPDSCAPDCSEGHTYDAGCEAQPDSSPDSQDNQDSAPGHDPLTSANAVRTTLDTAPCAQHPGAPVIGGMCGACTTHPPAVAALVGLAVRVRRIAGLAADPGEYALAPPQPAPQPAPTTYAAAQQQHIQLLRRRLAARQALDDAWDRLEEQAIHHLVHLASTEPDA